MPLNKSALLKKIVLQLEQELALYEQSARAAHAEATHEQNKAENKYDTRALEASYLAHGQSRQAAETEQARAQYEALVLRNFAAGDPIDLSALVELEQQGERALYFLGPRAGGMEIEHAKKLVCLITPQSPMGRQLVGKKQGDLLKVGSNTFRVVSVA